MGKILKIFFAIIVCAIALASCSNKECFDNQSTLPLAGFYSMQTKSQITVDSLTIYGIGAKGDANLLDNGRASSIYMPMPISGNSASFVFHYNAKSLNYVELNDTLTINYNSYPKFVSNECGAIYNYDVKDFTCTNHLIDSVAIPTMEFNNIDIEVIQIYFRTEQE